MASPAHAARVRANLRLFERPGGLLTSTHVTGAQWDAPFGWAPLQLFAVAGLRRYGFGADADRVARAWLSMLIEDFERRGTLVEKYDVERRTSDVAGRLAFGYTSNEIGFGWTNGVAVALLEGLGLARVGDLVAGDVGQDVGEIVERDVLQVDARGCATRRPRTGSCRAAADRATGPAA